MSQSDQFHESWAYLRDNAKPVREIDVWELREAREVHAPSKAHVKRLTRRRTVVEKPSFTPLATGDDPGGGRAELIRLQRLGRATLEACGINTAPYRARPLEK